MVSFLQSKKETIVRAHMQVSVHVSVLTCKRERSHASVHAHLYASPLASERARTLVCTLTCKCAHLHASVLTCV